MYANVNQVNEAHQANETPEERNARLLEQQRRGAAERRRARTAGNTIVGAYQPTPNNVMSQRQAPSFLGGGRDDPMRMADVMRPEGDIQYSMMPPNVNDHRDIMYGDLKLQPAASVPQQLNVEAPPAEGQLHSPRSAPALLYGNEQDNRYVEFSKSMRKDPLKYTGLFVCR